jgi:NADPH-dependent 2,4-dienoyl-CoA reductase/sulfur reductase-like enzyme
MEHFNLLIIGGDAAGMSAASQARRISDKLSIAVLDKGNHVSYAACGMPYFIADEVKDHNELIAIDKDAYTQKRNINIFTGMEVTTVDLEKKTLTALSNGNQLKYSYDKLIIATGAHPFVPPIDGINCDNVFLLRNLYQGIKIKEYIHRNKPEKGIIIGGGFIGLEMAEALRKLGIETTLIERLDSVATTMSPNIRRVLIDKLKENNVKLYFDTTVTSVVKGGDTGITIKTDNGDFETDFIILSVGILPNTGILSGTALKMTEKGAIIVNEHSMTSVKDVYAAGDCATVKHLITGEDFYMPLGSTANKQGRVAGIHAAGIEGETFKGIVGSQFVKIFDLEVGKTGFNEADATRHGIKSETVSTTWHSRAGYCPKAQSILVNITINTEDRVIIGGEIIGSDGAALRTNVVAAAIHEKMKVEDLAYLDLGYAPPFSPVWDPLNATAQRFIKR